MNTKLIPEDFVFTQSKLQTYTYCKFRFYLRYLRRLIWPAQLVSDQSYIADQQAGVRFHQLIHQFFIGFDLESIRASASHDQDPRIAEWLENFLSSPYSSLSGDLLPEKSYSFLLDGYRLQAKFDLLQLAQDGIRIYDWKTSRALPKAVWIRKNMQSMVYPLVVRNKFQKELEQIHQQQISMIYWEANFPQEVIEVVSGTTELADYEETLRRLIQEIFSLREEEYSKTPDLQKCNWCEYRSYCQRGKKAGSDIEETWLLLEDDQLTESKELSEPWEYQ